MGWSCLESYCVRVLCLGELSHRLERDAASRSQNHFSQFKVLAEGKLTKPLAVRVHAFSQQAKEKIMALGGSAEVV